MYIYTTFSTFARSIDIGYLYKNIYVVFVLRASISYNIFNEDKKCISISVGET